MLQTNLADATDIKAIEVRELNDIAPSTSLYDYSSGDVYVNVYDADNGRMVLSQKVTTEDADVLAEQFTEQYPELGFTVKIEV